MASKKKEYQDLLRRIREERNLDIEAEKAKANAFWDEREKNRAARKLTDISEVLLGHTRNLSERTNENDGKTWFNKGALDDGYDFGDITKTILGTGADLYQDFTTGLKKIPEGVTDLGAYLLGGGAKLLGQDDFADEMKEFISRDLVAEGTFDNILPWKEVDNAVKVGTFIAGDPESNSVLGEKTDENVQGAGQVLGQIALAGAGVPWWLTSGATASGGGIEEAFSEGATYGEAGAYGAITAVSEILFEKLSGGIKFGGVALDDGFKRLISRKISNKVLRTLTSFGMDAAGEGTEEVLTEIANNIGKKLTYADERTWNELLTSEEAMDNYINAFIGGTVIGGGFNARNIGRSIKSGRDYTTGLTDNEQTVFDRQVRDRTNEKLRDKVIEEETDKEISRQESTFGQLSGAERQKVRESILAKVDSGEISFEGRTLKQRERNQIEDQVRKELERGEIGIGDIERTLAPEESRTIENLEKALEAEKDEGKRNELETQIRESKSNLSQKLIGALNKDSYLQESYRQEILKSNTFERKKTKYDNDKTEALTESAKAAGMNDTRKSHELFEFVNKLAGDTDTEYGFVSNEQLKQLGYDQDGINGLVRTDKDGKAKVLINIDSPSNINAVIGHETTHLLETSGEYDNLQKLVKEYATTRGDYDAKHKRISELYKDTDADIDKEATADLIGEYLFTDDRFITELSTREPNIFKRIYDYIKSAVKMATAGSREERQLLKVQRSFEKAYRELNKKQGPQETTKENSGENTRFSLMQFEDGRRFVEITADTSQFDGLTKREQGRLAVKIIKEKFAGKVIGLDNRVFVNGRGAGEYGFPLKELGKNEHNAKMRASTELDNLLDAGTNFRNEPDGSDGHIHEDVTGGFDYFDTLFKVGDRYYEAVINIKNVKNGKLFKDVTKIKDVTEDISSSYGENPKSTFLRTSSIDNIPQDNEENNIKFSFAGENALNRDNEHLKRAKAMELAGETSENIRKETGWFRGLDGKWRFEIDDSQMEVDTAGKFHRNPDISRYQTLVEKAYFMGTATDAEIQELQQLLKSLEGVSTEPKKLGDLINYPQLFEAYPDLEDVDISYINDDGTKLGAYHTGFDEIVLVRDLKLNKEKLKRVLIHEIQHAIQKREDFAGGSSAEYFTETAPEPEEIYRERIKELTKEQANIWLRYEDINMALDKAINVGDEQKAQFYETLSDNIYNKHYNEEWFTDMIQAKSDVDTPNNYYYRLYWNTAGEIEARDTAQRIDYDETLRKANRPDIDREDAIIINDTRFSLSDKKTGITYQTLTAKPDMSVVHIEDIQTRNLSRSDIIRAARQSALNAGTKDQAGRIIITNIDTGKEIIVGAPSIAHGLTRKYETNAKIALNLGEFLKNSIKINELEARGDNSTGGYILLGYGEASNGDSYPAYFVVRTLTTGMDELVEFDTLYSFSGKKIKMPEAVNGVHRAFQGPTSDTISISNLLDLVNEAYSDILPKTVAAHYDIVPRASKLGQDTKYSLSGEDDIAPIGRWNTFSRDIVRQDNDIAPLRSDVIGQRRENANIGEAERVTNAENKTEADNINNTRALSEQEIKDISRSIKNKYSSKYDPTDEISRLYKNIHQGKYGINDIEAESMKIGQKIFENIEMKKERTEEASGLLKEIRKTRIRLNPEQAVEAASYYDSYNNYRKHMMGKVVIAHDGQSLDTKWQEWAEQYPALFDAETNSNEQPQELDRIISTLQNSYEVTEEPTVEDIAVDIYDQYYNTPLRNREPRNEKDVETLKLLKKKGVAWAELGELPDYISKTAKSLYDEVRSMEKGLRVSRELGYILDHDFNGVDKDAPDYEQMKDRTYKQITDALLNLQAKPDRQATRTEKFIRDSIVRNYDWEYAKIDEMKLDTQAQRRKKLRRSLIEGNEDLIIKALDGAKNIPRIVMNNTDTIRNTEMVFGRKLGSLINREIFQKEIDNEARSIAWQNKEREDIKKIGIKARSKESAAVQKWGEGEYVNQYGDLVEYTDSDLMEEFDDAQTREKIKKAAIEIKKKYEQYIDKVNEVLTGLGFDPINKRKDYMRHFEELDDILSKNGLPFSPQSMQEHVLPTDINGLTEFWSPAKNYFANAGERIGKRTTLDAITGIDGYISGIANLIYHTEDIQRGRAFEEIIRETYGQKTGMENLENLTEEERADRIEKINNNHLSNYASWVHEWTNNIAGKKNRLDRAIEENFGRKGYSVLDEARKQTGVNMVGYNVASSLTNLIASVQAAAKTNKIAVVKGTADTIKNIFIKDDFADKNNFLISRMGTEMISKTRWQKLRDAGFVFMKGMDWFSSNQIVRSKYYELIGKGMGEEQAHAEAGKFAARIMGDRTKGATAQLYNSKLFNLVAQFQLEVNNQLYSMFYDTYHESKEAAREDALKTAAKMTFTLGQLFAFTHVFGTVFESVAGYNPTFDVLGILATALGLGDDDDDRTTTERLQDAADQLVDALPYVNILTGGGRVPVAGSFPNLIGVMRGQEDNYGNELTISGELAKLPMLLAPGGYNQAKKTYQGLKMFDEDLPVTGSYTDSGNLRFPVEDTFANRIQAGLFGQYASENAREYFDKERAPLNKKQIQEYKEVDIPISDYWEYREGLKGLENSEEKVDYINSLDLPVSKKNILANNALNRKEKIDLDRFDEFDSLEEFDFYNKNPGQYAAAKAAGGYNLYKAHTSALNDLKADKDENGKSISGSRKEKVINYINSSGLSYGEKLILYKMQYKSDDTYNYEIVEYLNSLPNMSYDDIRKALIEMEFTVDDEGDVRW